MTLTTTHPNPFIAACLAPVEGAAANLETEIFEDERRVFYISHMLFYIAEHEWEVARIRRSMSIKGIYEYEPADAKERATRLKYIDAFDTLMRTQPPMRGDISTKRKLLKAHKDVYWMADRLEEYERILEDDDQRLAHRKTRRRN